MCWADAFLKNKFLCFGWGSAYLCCVEKAISVTLSYSLTMYTSLSLLAFVSQHTKLFSVVPSSTDFNLRIYTSTHAHVLSWGHIAASWNSPLADLVSQMTQWKWPVLSSAASQLHTITCFNVPCNNLWAAHSMAFVPQPFFFPFLYLHPSKVICKRKLKFGILLGHTGLKPGHYKQLQHWSFESGQLTWE